MPFVPGISCEAHRIGPGALTRVEIDIPIHLIVVVGPIATEQNAGIEAHNIGLKAETQVGLGARALELVVAREGEDVVSNEVGFAVMLMETAMRRAINEVALGKNPAAALIEINAPAAVPDAGDVVPQIVTNNGARLFAECVDAAHVAQNRTVAIRFEADVMNMVELDDVVAGKGGPITPGPANRSE